MQTPILLAPSLAPPGPSTRTTHPALQEALETSGLQGRLHPDLLPAAMADDQTIHTQAQGAVQGRLEVCNA